MVNKSLGILLFLLVISLLAFFVSGYTLYLQLGYIWLFVLTTSWLWTRLSLRNVNLERRATRKRSRVGAIFSEHVHLSNRKRLPLFWVEIIDRSILTRGRSSRVLTGIRGRSGFTYLNRMVLRQRGVFHLGPSTLRTSDPFGLFTAEKNIPAQDEIMVYPYLVDIQNFPNPAGRLPGGDALRRRTQQITTNATSVRPYQHGDALNRIHWLSTARHNQLMVREFELDPYPEIWLILDCHKETHIHEDHTPESHLAFPDWGTQHKNPLPADTFEYCVSITASLARYYIRKQRSLGLLCTTQKLLSLPPERSTRHIRRILEALTVIQDDGSMDISQFSSAYIRHLPRGCTMILVTPTTDPKFSVAIDTAIRMGNHPMVVWVNPASFNSETNIHHTADALRRIGIPTLSINLGDDLHSRLNMEKPMCSDLFGNLNNIQPTTRQPHG